MNDKEVWEDIDGYNDYYQISNFGRVRALRRTTVCKDGKPQTNYSKILKPAVQKDGYLLISLSKNNTQKKYLIHRLVAKCFIPNTENKQEVNHIDGNKKNNRVSNLEWVNRHENMRHRIDVLGFKGGLYGKLGALNKRSKIVLQIKNGVVIKEFYGSHEAERETGISSGSIRAACRGDHNSAGGFQWKYKTC